MPHFMDIEAKCVHACMLSHFSCVQLTETLWTINFQTLLSMGFSRQEYWSGLPCSSAVDLPYPGIKLVSFTSPELARGVFTTCTTVKTPSM